MRAIDVMVRDVVTVHPDTDVAEAIKLLAEHDVSALPVLDQAGNLVGVLSEADLIHRVEIGTGEAPAVVAGGGDWRKHARRRFRQVAWQEGRRDNDNGCRFGVRGDVAGGDCHAVRAKAASSAFR